MGCMCCKPSAIDDSKESPREPLSNKAVLDAHVSRGTSSRREEVYRVKNRYDNNDGRTALIDKQGQGNGPVRVQGDSFERKSEKMEYAVVQHPGIAIVPKAMEGEQVAAGWPSWLAAVAGEAIQGWLPRRADSFEKLDKVKCYMQQLLHGLDHCHDRGVLHRDIKGSNLLIDNNGMLKIADFGLASFFDPNKIQPLTSRVVTLWYRPPELLLGATYYGTAVDLWSTGCILAELYAGKPIMPGRTEVEQLHKIFKLCGSPSEDYWRKSKLPHATIFKPQQPYRRCVAETFKDFPAPAIELIKTLLSIDPTDRGTSASALKSEFFSTKPLPCDPSSLPKYPPSKEFDAKVREEEARRQGAAGSKAQRHDPERRVRESRAIPAPEANAELVLSMQKRRGLTSSQSRSEKFNPHPEEAASGFPIDPPRPSQAVEANADPQMLQHKRASHSGPLTHRSAWAKAGKNQDDVQKISAGGDLSAVSGLVAARRSMLSDDRRERSGSSQAEAPKLISRFPGSFKEASDSLMQKDQKHHHIHASQNEEGRGSNKDSNLVGYGSKGYKIHYSGPLLVPSNNMDQMLKDHDRQIQEAVRRARLDKAKMKRLQADNSLFVSGR
ncbi:probable serine/threonine-protein kinase At1g09600 isoform X2 [Lotus japonicus]|uniref:probable serine/threonine-protein kinase At1g09600 isoform X2 n=1 Tax=Lotus japonicus TaxID=34305 RepID=UPI00258C12A9|nr:probable serine/threonine-protein kinase At1g09600 isoform X2 [Lotus japonicus]